MKAKTEYFFLIVILLISMGLNLYGINWGLPSRWNPDQSVTPVLNMLKDKTFLPQIYIQPSLYYYVLILFLAPYLLYQYIFYTDFSSFVSRASVSWNYMAIAHPDIATGLFFIARLSSVIFSLLTILLVYRIGKIIHSNITGLFSALILTVTMDFVNWAHVEKSIPLVNLMTLLSVYYAILIFKGEPFRKNYMLCCLCGGLAFSVKFNGGITFLLIPILIFWQYLIKHHIRLSTGWLLDIFKMILSGVVIYLFIFLLTSPNILLEASRYYTESFAMRKGVTIPASLDITWKIWFPNFLWLSGKLIQMFGIPLAFLIGCGLLYTLFRYYSSSPLFFTIFTFPVVIICLFASSPRVYSDANSKFIIQVVPFLTILGGVFLDDLFVGKIMSKVKQRFKIVGVVIIFLISFFYCLSLDKIFAYDDLRYQTTKWVKMNLPRGANIIVNKQLEHSMGIDILKNYNVHVISKDVGDKGGHSFVEGEYFGIDDNRLQQIKELKLSYIVRPCWQLNQKIECTPINELSGELKLIKIFERNGPWYWNPEMGGYEPKRIEIYKRNNRE